MASRSPLAAFLAVLVAIGCSRAPDSAQLSELAAAAPALLAQAPSASIPKAAWPAAMVQLSPERVQAAPEGPYIVLSSTGVEERGLFVPRAAGFAGSAGTDPSYTPIGQGVFSYHVKG